MGKLFGTDGVRGIANTQLTPELVYKVGRCAAWYITKEHPVPKIVIGKDTRISCDMLEAALTAGILSAGIDVLHLGVIPTPAVAYLTKSLKAQAGFMISASHNPIADNGIKIFSSKGFKLPDKVEEEIEKLIFADSDEIPRPIGAEVGRTVIVEDASKLYVEYIKETIQADFSGLKVIMDCAHGAAYNIGPELFRELGAELVVLNNQPNGANINVQCGSTYPRILQKTVIAQEADIGIAFDGDADRAIFVDAGGHIIDGDHILTIFAQNLIKNGKLNPKKVVSTVMSNLGLEKALTGMGVELIRTKVGDRYVLEKMRQLNAVLGGEQSGHIIYLDFNTTGDGVFTAALTAKIMKEEQQSLSKLASTMQQFPQFMVNVKTKFKERLEQDEAISDAIKEMEELLKDRGRLLVRSSGTEPIVRVMAEGPDENEIKEGIDKIARIIEKKLN